MVRLNFFSSLLPQPRFIFKTILVTFFLAVTYMFFKDNGKKAKDKLLGLLKKPWLLAFIVYTAYILTSTIIGRYWANPLTSIWNGFGLLKANGEINTDLFTNLIMFVPYTFLYIKVFKPQSVWKTGLLLSLGTSLFIELSQLVGWLGNFQIADILYNIIGGLIGCGIWCLIQWIRQKHINK